MPPPPPAPPPNPPSNAYNYDGLFYGIGAGIAWIGVMLLLMGIWKRYGDDVNAWFEARAEAAEASRLVRERESRKREEEKERNRMMMSKSVSPAPATASPEDVVATTADEEATPQWRRAESTLAATERAALRDGATKSRISYM